MACRTSCNIRQSMRFSCVIKSREHVRIGHTKKEQTLRLWFSFVRRYCWNLRCFSGILSFASWTKLISDWFIESEVL